MSPFYKNIFIATLTILYSCVEPFQPDIPGNDKDFLVVDGIITDQEGPYLVKITKSSALNQDVTAATGAEVIIEEEGGLFETLTEIQDGVYQTDKLQGVTGKKYKLSFKYQNQDYQSSWEKINASPTIDSLYYTVDIKQTTDIDNDVSGLNFFIDNHAPLNQTNFFRFEWEESWKIGVPQPTYYDYVGNDQVEMKTDLKHFCWKSNNSLNINTGNTLGLTENILSQHPLTFISGDDERFTIKYSLLVKQYALNEREYLFWQGLEESNEQLGGLMDKQPARVIGNLINTTNSNDVVLGYFSASGIQEKRLFVGRTDLPHNLTRIPSCPPPECYYKDALDCSYGDDYEEAIFHAINSGKRMFFEFIYAKPPPDPIIIGAFLSVPYCSDCTLKGGDLTKPDFWED